MANESVITRSGQSGKLVAGVLALLGSGALMFYGLARLSEPNGFTLVLTGLGTAWTAMVLTCLAVRCRSCGTRWVWMAVRHQQQAQWMKWLLSQPTCPTCGDDGSVR